MKEDGREERVKIGGLGVPDDGGPGELAGLESTGAYVAGSS